MPVIEAPAEPRDAGNQADRRPTLAKRKTFGNASHAFRCTKNGGRQSAIAKSPLARRIWRRFHSLELLSLEKYYRKETSRKNGSLQRFAAISLHWNAASSQALGTHGVTRFLQTPETGCTKLTTSSISRRQFHAKLESQSVQHCLLEYPLAFGRVVEDNTIESHRG